MKNSSAKLSVESLDCSSALGPSARVSRRGRAVFGIPAFDRKPAGRLAAAFTITEILIVIAIILLVSGFGAADMMHIANSVQQRSPNETLKDAMREARFVSQTTMRETVLYYRPDTASIVIVDDKDTVIEEFPLNLGKDEDGTKYSLTFTPIMPLEDLDSDFPKDPTFSTKTILKRLTFNPSGSTMPAQVVFDDGKNKDTFILDPFSSGPAPKAPAK